MKKALLLIFLSFFISIYVYSAQAKSKTFVYDIEENYASIQKYIGNEETVRIPNTVAKKVVTKINTKAFINNKKITTVYLSSNISEIGEEAFSGCENLQTIYVRTDIKKITMGTNCFAGCGKLDLVFISSDNSDISTVQKKISTPKVPGGITGVFGIEFGTDEQTVKSKMKELGWGGDLGKYYKEGGTYANLLVENNKGHGIGYRFYKNKLYVVNISIDSREFYKFFETLDVLKESLVLDEIQLQFDVLDYLQKEYLFVNNAKAFKDKNNNILISSYAGDGKWPSITLICGSILEDGILDEKKAAEQQKREAEEEALKEKEKIRNAASDL